MVLSRAECQDLDAKDPLGAFRDEFSLPPGVVYLLGNSLGALPRHTPERVAHAVETEWGVHLGASWNTAGWWDMPQSTGDRIAPLVGARPGDVLAGDSTSVNIFKVVTAALPLRPGRRVIVSDLDNFPTDRYVVEGAARALGAYEIRDVGEAGSSLEDALGEDVALVLLSHVDYRTGEARDMAAVTELVRAAGALMVWDLCHSAGALPVRVGEADFAVGCTYKYLNGGPGAPAYLYVAPRHQDAVHNVLSGWHGHAAPFDFEPHYRPAPGVRRFATGSPPILSYAALNASLDIWERVDLDEVRAKSLALTSLFIDLLDDLVDPGLGLALATPRDPERRGSQISYRHPQGYPVVRALADRGVVGDYREPDFVRFGFAPLYLRHVDVYDAATALAEVLGEELWRDERYAARLTVT
ncbi:kynureninase [Microbispora bryophytorum]|uniref:Kynureninase n=1 Tax=Microbispora bryophytorum TaxID=1460882 RepID=A0A8H9H9X0_9ACTN|nr:kynureninase [Microbispora bryophytorum]MBD3141363.1 kynureninase [Microbispora bryophytorum]TQS02440.1 kynureninase [Microbispora bryophytorum]GGO28267.1 kynureninase [Microbispora bryophytorum]